MTRAAFPARFRDAGAAAEAARWVLHAHRVSAWDHRLFHKVAARHWPGGDRVLPRLSKAANHGGLWFAVAAGIAATRHPAARRTALRGVASLAVASATVNTLGKRAVRRARPILDNVPVVRQLHTQPVTTSFPSGHSASAAAFTTGLALENPRWGAAVAPLAAAVAFSRVYTGVHYPSDVLAGAAIGVGAAFAVRGLAPTRSQLPTPARPLSDAPALRGGKGLVLVANASSGQRTAEPADGADDAPAEEPAGLAVVRALLPDAEIVLCDPRSDDVAAAFDEGAARAAETGGALGVLGGDGTINCAARAAVRHGLPLAVLPGGTRNHFAYDLGIETAEDACRAVVAGDAVAVDLARFTPGPEGSDGHPGYFLNTFSLGSYPELVRMRERWAPRIGAWPAGVLAAMRVLHTAGPVEAGLGGRQRPMWQLFVGNCTYRGLGVAPVRRHDLADGLLDVRVVPGGRWPRSRLLAAALTSVVGRSPVHSTARLRRLRISDIPDGTHLAFDGEVARAPRELLIDKQHEALTVYRPLDHGTY
ncbi:phosphatase PAP2 family protein [Streptomyces sp. RKND-216]|uniref:bifunctional phosphatase PAP2/diacylglycerol kinase family protein n=1 Tax=Streptomyces sp. RKND-216 TaxID=2562581 RepID=UPI00109E1DCE|nr:phosphatase PAP2 family protein [Streptomyces sp. RKND-216]THA23528.1 phosphatase PAP2 family protein [Streptomyces sp. RKND-216]